MFFGRRSVRPTNPQIPILPSVPQQPKEPLVVSSSYGIKLNPEVQMVQPRPILYVVLKYFDYLILSPAKNFFFFFAFTETLTEWPWL